MSDLGAESGSVAAPWLSGLSEREFQKIVVEGLKQRGYVVFVFPEMRRTRAGWPDLTFVHPRRPGCVWFWELKRAKGKASADQLAALAMLGTVPGADVRIVRPADWLTLSGEV